MPPQAPPRPRQPLRRSARALSAVAFAAPLALLLAAPAAAHGRLMSTSPAGGATVSAAPSSIRMLFDEEVQARFSAVAVTGPSGVRLDRGGPEITGTTVDQPVRPLTTAGAYVVAYRVVSADGHPVSGQFRFTYAPARPRSPATAAAAAPSRPTGSTRPAAAQRATGPAAAGGHLLHYVGSVLAIVVTLAVIAVERVRARRRG